MGTGSTSLPSAGVWTLKETDQKGRRKFARRANKERVASPLPSPSPPPAPTLRPGPQLGGEKGGNRQDSRSSEDRRDGVLSPAAAPTVCHWVLGRREVGEGWAQAGGRGRSHVWASSESGVVMQEGHPSLWTQTGPEASAGTRSIS